MIWVACDCLAIMDKAVCVGLRLSSRASTAADVDWAFACAACGVAIYDGSRVAVGVDMGVSSCTGAQPAAKIKNRESTMANLIRVASRMKAINLTEGIILAGLGELDVHNQLVAVVQSPRRLGCGTCDRQT